MVVGIPKEIKSNENRVGMTPAGIFELTKSGHTCMCKVLRAKKVVSQILTTDRSGPSF